MDIIKLFDSSSKYLWYRKVKSYFILKDYNLSLGQILVFYLAIFERVRSFSY